MGPVERFRTAFLRWDRMAALIALGLPFVVCMVLGFFWLAEHGVLLGFIGASILLGAVVAGLRWVLRRRDGKDDADDSDTDDRLTVHASAEWNARETAAFDKAKTLIARATREPVDWDAMRPLALDVANTVVQALGGDKKSALDFTLPEALLLAEKVAARYRRDLKHMVPFSDSVSLTTILWLLNQKDRAKFAYRAAEAGWRLTRMAANPVSGVLREVERVIAGGHSGFLGTQATAVLQAVLLEEIARVAVDLYSGRLKFSDAELLEIQLSALDADRERLAHPDSPLRVVFAGQVSVGKSSLINALIGSDLAETDLTPTTDKPAIYEAEIDGIDCLLLDTPGLDGSAAVRKAVLHELTEADIVIWIARANRPARAIDADLIGDLKSWFADRPDRRRPPIISAASFADRLAPGWPYPEHALPAAVRDDIATMVRAIGRDLRLDNPVPVCTVPPEWNLDTLRRAITGAFPEGLMTQRNRLRLSAPRRTLRTEARRTTRGLIEGSRSLGWRFARRTLLDDPPD